MTMKGVSKVEEEEVLGLVPHMVFNADTLSFKVEEFVSNLESAYGFPLSEMGGKVVDGIYTYPKDRDLDWLAKYTSEKFPVTVYQYPYGIVAIIFEQYGEQTQYITRMD